MCLRALLVPVCMSGLSATSLGQVPPALKSHHFTSANSMPRAFVVLVVGVVVVVVVVVVANWAWWLVKGSELTDWSPCYRYKKAAKRRAPLPVQAKAVMSIMKAALSLSFRQNAAVRMHAMCRDGVRLWLF